LDLRAWHDRLRPSGLQPPLAGNAVFGVAKKAVLRLLKENHIYIYEEDVKEMDFTW
jgi:hypothetical protein